MISEDRLRKLIHNEYMRCPESEIQDYTKLIFQAAFGPEHSIADPERVYAYLLKELEATPADPVSKLLISIRLEAPVYRLNLSACRYRWIEAPSIHQAFCYSAAGFRKIDINHFSAYLKMMLSILSSEPLNFNPQQTADFLRTWESLRFPALHHTEKYKRLYHPNYRVITDEAVRLFIKNQTGTF